MRAFQQLLGSRPALAALALLAAAAAAGAAGNARAQAPSTIGALHAIPGGVELRRGTVLTRVVALSPGVLRVRVAPSGTLPEDASWAVDASTRAHPIAVTPSDTGFATDALTVRIDRATGRLAIADRSGRPVLVDRAEGSLATMASGGFTVRKELPLDRHVYAFGDKTGDTLDRRGRSFVDWNTDAYAFDASTDPLYKSIPFFLSIGSDGNSSGVFLDNSWRSWFDFGHRERTTLAFGSDGGPIDYYVIAGPTPRDVVRRYVDLTGHAPLPPRWALGYQQSRYSYMSADEVREVADGLARSRIPVDAMWLDIDFLDRNRPFTHNPTTYPDVRGLVRAMAARGIKLAVISDLHVAHAPGEGYAPYDTGAAIDAFAHAADGQVYVGKVWPGPSVFPDFTAAPVRRWWGTNFRGYVADGIAGFWNDMNEPSVFNTLGTMPDDATHAIASDDFAPRRATHAEVHNILGFENTRATFDGIAALRPGERPFVMTRASYAGGQRYGVTWTGDNSSTWNHLRLAIDQIVNLGLSGFAYAGADVGGYRGGATPALMTRWYQVAAFMPVFRAHAEKGSPRAEPWVDGKAELAIRRRYVEEHYRLLPYIEALSDDNARTGDPIVRPVFYDHPGMVATPCKRPIDFMLGDALLIAPAPDGESARPYDVCLPKGGWYDYWTGRRVAANPVVAADAPAPGEALVDRTTETPRPDRLPVFVRAGAILPRQPVVANTGVVPDGPLTLDVFPGPDCHGSLYADDGHSLGYRQGAVFRQTVRCEATGDGGLTIRFLPAAGRYRPWWRRIALVVHEASAPLHVAGHRSAFDSAARTVTIELPRPAPAAPATLTLRPEAQP